MNTATPPLGTAQVVLNTRTLRIGHQTYQLQNLARVQTLLLAKPHDAGKGSKGLAWLAGLGTFIVVGVILAAAAGSGVLGTLGLLLGLAVGIGVYVLTKQPYVPMYALMLETTGNPVTALVSPDPQELERTSAAIVNAIEHPPSSELRLQVANVVLGDQYNQNGVTNVGRIGRPV